MKTYKAIDIIKDSILNDSLADAIFLKGSIGRGEDDKYSDVDMYVLVSEENKEKFLNKRLDYLKRYKEILYIEHVNFVAEQMVVIFEDGLHFDFYTVTKDTKLPKDEVKVLYDKNNFFKNYKASFKSIPDETFIKSFDDLSFYYTEIYAAYKRNNLLWANRLLSHALGNITILIRSLYDNKYPYLGFKKINKIIPNNLYEKLLYASDQNNSKTLKEAYLSIIDLQKFYMEHCSENIRNSINLRFFKYVEDQVKSNF